MALTRRDFLRRTSLALPALLVGDAALEAFERLTHRKVFALGWQPTTPPVLYYGEWYAVNGSAIMRQTPSGWREIWRLSEDSMKMARMMHTTSTLPYRRHGMVS